MGEGARGGGEMEGVFVTVCGNGLLYALD